MPSVVGRDPTPVAWANCFHVGCALLLMAIGALVMGGVGLYALLMMALTEFHPKAVLVLLICGFVFIVPAFYLFHMGWALLRRTRKVPDHTSAFERP